MSLLAGTVACDNHRNDRDFSLNSIANPSDADSLMYYFGQLRAVKYMRDSELDTMLTSKEAEKEYLEGLREGLKSLKRSEAYMLGLLSGAEHAYNIRNYSRNYDREFNPDVMIRSMTAALESDSDINVAEARRNFYNLRNRMESDRNSRDIIEARKALASRVETLGMSKIHDNLWNKVLIHGGGKSLERGDRISVAMALHTIDGQRIPLRLPTEYVVGGRFISTIVTDAMLSMHYGDRCEFATSALALFGSHCDQMSVSPDDVMIITISVLGELEDNELIQTDTDYTLDFNE